jgi:AsmA protein
MPKSLKYLVIAIIALLTLLIIGAAIIAATFNPNDYKPMIIKLVQEKKQRTLSIPGEIKLTFFPRIGADLGKLSISEHKSKDEFASINSATVSVALIPLLSKNLVVDHVRIDGLQANIKRYRNGSTNFDDLLAKEESQQSQQEQEQEQEKEQVEFNIAGVKITDAAIRFDDQQQQRKVEITDLDLDTGKIASGVASRMTVSANINSNNPVINAKVAGNTGFMIDLDKKHYVLTDTDAQLKGKLMEFSDLALDIGGNADLKPDEKRFVLEDIALSASGKRAGQPLNVKFGLPELAITDTKVSGGKLTGEAKFSEGARNIAANFSAPSFEGSPQAFKVPALALDIAIKEAQLDAAAKISGAISGNIDKLLFNSPQLKLVLSGKQGDTALDGTLTSPFSANLKSGLVELSDIVAAFTLPNPGGGMLKLNASGRTSADLDKQTMSTALKGKFDESSFDARLGMAKFSPAAYTFDVTIDRLNADRYKAKTAQTQKSEPKPEAEAPIDLSGLHDLRASGSLKIGALTVENIKTSNVRLDLRAGDGRIAVNPLSASLYGGTVTGSLSATASKAPRFAVRQNLVGVDIGPLLKDAIGKDPIEGRGNVSLDVTAGGGSFTQLKKNLNGTAQLALRDGAVRGVNVAQTVRTAKTKIGALKGDEPPQTGTGSTAEKTDFSEMTGSFKIVNGVARNEDLDVKSPLIRVNGSGAIDLGEERVDYLAKTTVVSTLKGQGGPEMEALKGLTVPVRLSGPFTAIGWRIDFAGLASEMAKQKIDEKKDEVKAKVQDRLREELKGLFKK